MINRFRLNSDFFWSESNGVTNSQRIGVKPLNYPLWVHLGINGVFDEGFRNQLTFLEVNYENTLYGKKWLRYNIALETFIGEKIIGRAT